MSRGSEELRSRTKQYASRIVRLYVSLPKARAEAQVLGKQLLRSGTSVAANFREASRARSTNEFISKFGQKMPSMFLHSQEKADYLW